MIHDRERATHNDAGTPNIAPRKEEEIASSKLVARDERKGRYSMVATGPAQRQAGQREGDKGRRGERDHDNRNDRHEDKREEYADEYPKCDCHNIPALPAARRGKP